MVKPGDKLKVEKINLVKDEPVEFETFMTSNTDGGGLVLGTPTITSKVKGKILEQSKGKKVRVVHYKAKTRQHKVYGHRQPYSKVEISEIG